MKRTPELDARRAKAFRKPPRILGVCSKCRTAPSADGQRWCQGCQNDYVRERRELYGRVERRLRQKRYQRDPVHYFSTFMFNGAKSSSHKHDLPFDLDKDWIRERVARGVCEVTGIPFEFNLVPGKRPFVPSLDQRVARAGYLKSNCQVVVWIYNAAKANWGHEPVQRLAAALTGSSQICGPAVSRETNRG